MMTSELAEFVERLLDILAFQNQDGIPSEALLDELRKDFRHAQHMAQLGEADCEEY